MNPSQRRRWAEHLRRLAQPVLARVDPHTAMREALRRPHWLAGPLIAHCLHEAGLAAPPEVRDDLALWWGLLDPCVAPAGSIVDLAADGPLFAQDAFSSIEVWTETELAGLHALGHHAQRNAPHPGAWASSPCENASSPCEKSISSHGLEAHAPQSRMARVVEWHIRHTQPDNATNHPWAVHIFLLHDTPESRHFAETLLSNCLVMHGEPDEFSAWILRDAAEALDVP
jgi:hypothetical protein